MCGETTEPMAYSCDYCNDTFCRDHRLPELHNCRRISDAEPPDSRATDPSDEVSRETRVSAISDFRESNIDLDELRERAKAESQGQPFSVVEPEHTVGTTPDSDFESSPDVAIDGSIKQEPSQQKTTQDEPNKSSGITSWVRLLILFGLVIVGILFAAYFFEIPV